MVGYNKHETLSTSQKLLAGCLSGVMTRFITQPMDVVKIRTQLQKSGPRIKKRKIIGTTKKILREEGIFAFWHGHNIGQVHSVLSVSSQFYVYEIATKYFASVDIDDNHKFVSHFVSGILAGCCSAFIVLPLDVIRLRQMLVQDQYKGFFNGARRVYKAGGFFAFYEGLSASLLQMGPQVGISFSVFSFLQPRIIRLVKSYSEDRKHAPPKPQDVLLASSIAGSIAGFVSKTMTYPFDLLKRRLQVSSHVHDDRFAVPSTVKKIFRCERLLDCFTKTIRKEGFLGLYKGWNVTVYKAQVTSITAFTTYEITCYIFRKFFVDVKP